mmetsp:Transcript_77990/g.137447  ORF Transcript_77990/g.137447 Transcript_77990/m.137447 type:complete len:258 (+) Transcript_77990:86-859(+)
MSEWITPSSSFLCCFEPSLGVKLLMWPHLFLAIYTVAMATEEIVIEGNGDFQAGNVFDMIWSLIGIPIIAVGLWGVYHRIEPHVRYYLYYLSISVLIDMYYVITYSLNTDACTNIRVPADASKTIIPEASNGKAFACGVATTMTTSSAVVLVLLSLWAIYIVWSWCEDAEGSTAAWALSDLLALSEGRPLAKREGYWSVSVPEVLGDAIDTGESIYSGAKIVYGALKESSRRVGSQAEKIAEYEEAMLEGYMERNIR